MACPGEQNKVQHANRGLNSQGVRAEGIFSPGKTPENIRKTHGKLEFPYMRLGKTGKMKGNMPRGFECLRYLRGLCVLSGRKPGKCSEILERLEVGILTIRCGSPRRAK